MSEKPQSGQQDLDTITPEFWKCVDICERSEGRLTFVFIVGSVFLVCIATCAFLFKFDISSVGQGLGIVLTIPLVGFAVSFLIYNLLVKAYSKLVLKKLRIGPFQYAALALWKVRKFGSEQSGVSRWEHRYIKAKLLSASKRVKHERLADFLKYNVLKNLASLRTLEESKVLDGLIHACVTEDSKRIESELDRLEPSEEFYVEGSKEPG